VIRRALAASAATAASVVTLRFVVARGRDRLLEAPRVGPDEDALGPALDALGGEVVRIRARDGLRLAGRWLPADAGPSVEGGWRPDPHEAIVLLHGWTGSCAPDLVGLGPSLRRTAGVLGLDFRGHGGSDPSPTTFGLREIDDVAGALAWLGSRGIERVALVGRSMGGGTAIASVVVLGDGGLPGVDADLAAPAHLAPPTRPRIVAVVGDSVTPELWIPVASRLPGPARRRVAEALLGAVARSLGADPRATEPRRVVGLLEGTPLLLISGAADETVPLAYARRLAAAAPPGTPHWIVPDADHDRAHAVDPEGYERHVTDHLRAAFSDARGSSPIIATPAPATGGAEPPATYPED
jgi:pimeloyl-ACP methyl ester carboxylesterase